MRKTSQASYWQGMQHNEGLEPGFCFARENFRIRVYSVFAD